MKDEIQWWGYKHVQGSYQTKPYFGEQDIKEAEDSPFCETVVGPFKARGREHALTLVEVLVKEKEKLDLNE